jgi:hypothetical protein
MAHTQDVSRSTHVRDSNLGHIARLSCLTYLTFSDTNISDEGVMHLANGTRVSRVVLRVWCRVSSVCRVIVSHAPHTHTQGSCRGSSGSSCPTA